MAWSSSSPSSSSLAESVAHLSPDATFDVVETALTPHMTKLCSIRLGSTFTNTNSSVDSNGMCKIEEMLAPALWLACDRGHLHAVRFLLQQAMVCMNEEEENNDYRREHQHDGRMSTSTSSSRKDPDRRRHRICIQHLLTLPHATTGNTAAHYAALSQNLNVFLLLQEFYNDDENATRLWTTVNHYGDTPLMMACVAGSIDLVQHMLSQATATNNISALLNARNQSNDSALSLACGHGHVEIVKLLLGPADPCRTNLDIQDDDWLKAQASWHKLNQAALVSDQLSVDQRMLLQQKRNDAQLCLTLVRGTLQRRADDVSKELLSSLEESDPSLASKKKVKGRPKPKKKKVTKVNEMATNNADTANNTSWDQQKKDTVVLTQLRDGTRAVAVVGVDAEDDNHDDNDNDIAASLANLPTAQPRPSPDDLLLWRATIDETSRDMMRALCLNASLLLQTPHGLALHCSPAQLDGIETILQRQLEAVQQARSIHLRVRATVDTRSNTHSSSNNNSSNDNDNNITLPT